MEFDSKDFFNSRIWAITLFRENSVRRGYLACAHELQFLDLEMKCGTILHSNELSYFKALKFDKRRRTYMLGRYAGKKALSKQLNELDLTEIEIGTGVFTQPVVRYLSRDHAGVSISHTNSYACALSYPEDHPMGIDLEMVVDSKVNVMKSQILEEELQLAEKWKLNQTYCSTVIWTAKEALSKVVRCGMMNPFEGYAICELEQTESCFLGKFRNFGQYRFQSWVLDSFVLTIVLPKKTQMKIEVVLD
jgi:phosphopantetheinyl transferase (holo-ACP synthase)